MLLDIVSEAVTEGRDSGFTGEHQFVIDDEGVLSLRRARVTPTRGQRHAAFVPRQAFSQRGLTSRQWDTVQEALLLSGADSKGCYDLVRQGRRIRLIPRHSPDVRNASQN